MKQKGFFALFAVILVLTLVFTVLPRPELTPTTLAQDEPLTAISVTEAPTLDGVAEEAFWADAPSVEIPVRRGANTEETTVVLKAVYTEDRVYFLVTWADPTESFIRAPWEMQADGTWTQLKDPDDKGGDNNLWYEDKLAIIWPINNSIPDFEDSGCFTACHRSEDDDDPKPFGNKFTDEEGQTGDIWHWKSVRNFNQMDDQYLDSVQYSEDTPEAGRHSDSSDSGGYKNNINEDKTGPAFMPAGDDFPRDGSPGYILESEAVPFDASLFEPGDRVPGILKSEIVGDRGDIAAGWVWGDGVWTLEFGRDLVTDSEVDVQFDDLSATYFFGVATFDNAQVRHAFHRRGVPFVFEQ